VADGTDTICTAVQVIRIGSFDASSHGLDERVQDNGGEYREVKPRAATVPADANSATTPESESADCIRSRTRHNHFYRIDAMVRRSQRLPSITWDNSALGCYCPRSANGLGPPRLPMWGRGDPMMVRLCQPTRVCCRITAPTSGNPIRGPINCLRPMKAVRADDGPAEGVAMKTRGKFI
jgi:hypothetical protein